MKKKDLVNLREKSVSEIEKELATLKTKLFDAKISRSTGKETNLKVVRLLKKEVSQLMTIISEKQEKGSIISEPEVMQKKTTKKKTK